MWPCWGMAGASAGEHCRSHLCPGVDQAQEGLPASHGGWEGQEVAPGRGGKRDRAAFDRRGLGAQCRAGRQGWGDSLKSELETGDSKKEGVTRLGADLGEGLQGLWSCPGEQVGARGCTPCAEFTLTGDRSVCGRVLTGLGP